MIISGGDKDWENQLSTAFTQRIEFELRDIDKLKFSDAQFYQRISEWTVLWNYTPTLINLTSINFRPDELPATNILPATPPPPGNRVRPT